MSSPKLLRKKVSRNRLLRVLVLGQPGVGKTALTVRLVTKRFIGEYDPTLEKKYSGQLEVDGEQVNFEIFDTAGQAEETIHLESNIRWADAFILVYSVADRCSFDDCTRLKFLINHVKRNRRSSTGALAQAQDIPVAMVGNQNDREPDRMVATSDGQQRSRELGCTHCYDISVRESYEQVKEIFSDLSRYCKNPRRSKKDKVSPPQIRKRATTVAIFPVEQSSTLSPTKEQSEEVGRRKISMSRKIMQKVIPAIRLSKDFDFSHTESSDS